MAINGLIFDAYGTPYDVHSVEAKTEQLCPGKSKFVPLYATMAKLRLFASKRTIAAADRPS